MNPTMRRNFSGAFLAQPLGGGGWRLYSDTREAAVFVQGADSGAEAAFGTGALTGLGIEWNAETVLLSFTAAGKAATVGAAGAIVHEPLNGLYDNLLPQADARARRFWRRVFLLMRIPGGRHLLKLLAR